MSRRAAYHAAVYLAWLGITVMAVLGGWTLYQRVHRSDEQVELERYVQMEVPSLEPVERDVLARLAPLSARRDLGAEEARKLLVDDVIPRLVRLRRRAAQVEAKTAEVQRLTGAYVAWIDALIEACRASVRAIDAPAGGGAEGGAEARLGEIRRRFAEADAAAKRWSEDVRAACVKHRLAPPR